MRRHYLVISDLHLCEVEDHADGWKVHKHSRFTFDAQLAQVVERLLLLGDPADERTLVLNGDIIDFDLVTAVPPNPPWPVSAWERAHGLEASEEKSVWKLERVLVDHPGFVETLARLIGAGHRVVYVLGNHDPELHFPAVQGALATAVARAAAAGGLDFVADRLTFEPWFYYVPGELYAEHGQQYDSYTCFRYVLDPVERSASPPTVALPMGNLSNRHLMSQMGFFNPHASDFILNMFRYLTHWLRHYAFSRRRHLVINWLLGSLYVLQRLYRTKNRVLRHPPDHAALLAAVADRNGIPLETVHALDRLKRGPITNRIYRVVREFWIDRLLLAGIMWVSTAILALLPVPLWVKLMVPLSSFPLLFLIYEWFAHGETIFSVERETLKSARRIAQLLPLRIVTFGHTHVPGLVPVAPGVSYVNTGTWAPVTRQRARHLLKWGLRNALFASFDDGQVQLHLETCLGDELSETATSAPAHGG